MNILTINGYVPIENLNVGDEVVAFDAITGAPIVNTVLGKELMTRRSNLKRMGADADGKIIISDELQYEDFDFYLINGQWNLFMNQSIWRNGIDVCHASDLVVGDVIYDDDDNDVIITSIVKNSDLSQWWRLEISGDHSYIADNVTLHNASRYWVGGGSSNAWNATGNTNWSSSSGGSNNASVPTSSDDVYFNENSFATAGLSVRLTNSPTCNNMSWFNVTNNPDLYSTSFDAITIDGTSVIFGTGMTVGAGGQTGGFWFDNAGTTTLTTNGVSLVNAYYLYFSSGEVSLQDDLTFSVFVPYGGTMTTNNHDVNLSYLSGGSSTTWNLGSSTVTITGNGDYAWSDSSLDLTLDAGTSTIIFTGLDVRFGTNAAALAFYNVSFTNTSSTSNTIKQQNNTSFNNFTVFGTTYFSYSYSFNTLYLNPGKTYVFNSGFTYTLNNLVNMGASTATLQAWSAGTPFNFASPSGTIVCDYLSLKDSHATQANKWYAGTHSTNVSGNTNWIFTAPPSNNSSFLMFF